MLQCVHDARPYQIILLAPMAAFPIHEGAKRIILLRKAQTDPTFLSTSSRVSVLLLLPPTEDRGDFSADSSVMEKGFKDSFRVLDLC